MRSAQDDYLIIDLHCFIQAMPPETERLLSEVDGTTVECLQIPSHQQALPLQVSFEEVLDQLTARPTCHTEPDGWFLWSGNFDTKFWSLNGQLTDDGNHLLFVELRGDCPRSVVGELQEMLSANNRQLVFQLPDRGLFVDTAGFGALFPRPISP